ncbi:uncharacterized protein YjlB [Bacillus ectoiniformans]|uniref:cupin domain-containing protein n=1 Tax=Bacillus ectoiniformans TaxID=1494429 RepID=UPI00195B1F1E|nr:cupin domain-containing protein [Bacillus ectoiniformans]MBM7648214.1 uncharacterized protein YjlB [Bacillus ectoiniformans]
MKSPFKSFMLQDDGIIPNNPDLPVLVYEGPFKDCPNEIEHIFNRHQWSNSWINGIFDFHHYHSNAHEVLGVKAGSAVVLIGGEKGQHLNLSVGDVLVLPAGTGHKKLESSQDFQVVGAYPNGQSYNMRKSDPSIHSQSMSEIANVSIPQTDPVYGDSGPLLQAWKK